MTRGVILGSRQGEERILDDGLKISLACGKRKPKGYLGVDIADIEGVDIVCDLLVFPWPLEDECAQEVEISHFVEHIPHRLDGCSKDGFFAFFDEVYRICKKGAVVNVVHPHAMSSRAFQDPTHERYINEATWLYLSKSWRRSQGLDHYPTEVDFDPIKVQAIGVRDEIYLLSKDEQSERVNHHWNIVSDLEVQLRKL